MYESAFDYDPIGPAGGTLLAEAGIDYRAVGEAIAQDRTMRCPDRETMLRGGPVAVRDTAMPFPGGLCGAAMPQPFPQRPSRRTVR